MVALVTGAASGSWAGIAQTFAREGAKVGIPDINSEGAHAVAAGIGPAATAFAGDVTSAKDVAQAVEAISQAHGRIDIVVNNAGWSYRNRALLEVTEAEFDRVFAINVKSIFHMTHAVVPRMR